MSHLIDAIFAQLDRVDTAFDDEGLVAKAGLLLPATLTLAAGQPKPHEQVPRQAA